MKSEITKAQPTNRAKKAKKSLTSTSIKACTMIRSNEENSWLTPKRMPPMKA